MRTRWAGAAGLSRHVADLAPDPDNSKSLNFGILPGIIAM